MNFHCEKPEAFFALILLAPALVIAVRGALSLRRFDDRSSAFGKGCALTRPAIVRTAFFALSWLMLVAAYAGFSWGARVEAAQKSGNAVSFVFDISYSMTAKDCPGGMTRLEAASKYASALLERLEGAPVSVTLAKGDGINVIPLTDDKSAVETLLSSLSPALMSAAGSSLGKGIRAALNSIPENSSFAHAVWVFTDGDETDGQLENSLGECIRHGVKVCIAGFGNERESETLAGDGITPVRTALRASRIKNAVSSALKKNKTFVRSDSAVVYVNAFESGSAVKLLQSVSARAQSRHSVSHVDWKSGGDASAGFSSVEIKSVPRYKLFLSLAIAFFASGFVFSQFGIENLSSAFRKKSALIVLSSVFMLSSCTSKINGARTILTSAWAYEQKRYAEASAGFFAATAEADGDDVLRAYALYGLAASYFMQNETVSAMERFAEIADGAPAPVKYASYYNMGLIADKNGDYKAAADYFKEALKADCTKPAAKINLELSLQRMADEAAAKQRELAAFFDGEAGGGGTEDTIFKRIKENDKKQWQSGADAEGSSSLDY
ncbi:MAG: VWA domain-containing protein [Treponema sp.]